MALVGVPPPRLPEPPEQITREYVEDLVRTLEIFIGQERNPGELRATKITLTDLPTSSIASVSFTGCDNISRKAPGGSM